VEPAFVKDQAEKKDMPPLAATPALGPVAHPMPLAGLAVGPSGVPSPLVANDWAGVWGPAVASFDGWNHIADIAAPPDGGKKKKAAWPALTAAAADCKALLLDPLAASAGCRAAVIRMRDACRAPGWRETQSKLPTWMLTTLLEFVNVKRLWETGDTRLRPGRDVRTTNKKDEEQNLKPDYTTPDTDRAEFGEVGDHVRVMKPAKSPKELLDEIADGVKDKLTTYPKLIVRVVVDVMPSGDGAATLAADPDVRQRVIEAVRTIAPPIRSRLSQVDVVLSDTVLVTVRQGDLA
jgi:hypothetical protein